MGVVYLFVNLVSLLHTNSYNGGIPDQFIWIST